MSRNRASKVTEPTLETNSNPHRFKRIPVRVLNTVPLMHKILSFFLPFPLCLIQNYNTYSSFLFSTEPDAENTVDHMQEANR